MKSLTPEELAALEAALPTMSAAEKEELLGMLSERERRASLEAARTSMLGFAHSLYPGFKEGPHHRKLARVFEDVISGKKRRVIINIAPRMGKSEFSSYLFPAFFLGKYPNKKIIMATHTSGLSEDFGRRVRNLIDSPEYKEVFPGTAVAADQKAAGKWSTSEGGQYYAAGVGGALAGRGADLFVIDDPHSEQDIKTNSKATFESAWSWFQTGPLQRLMPGGAIIVIMTRWALTDLTGKLIKSQITTDTSADPWEIVELPAILPSGKSLWPEQWPLEALESKRAAMDPQYWNAQYMQNPVSDLAAMISRKSWMLWEKEKPPKVEYIIQSWDTAHSVKDTADYSACTTWGVWYDEERKNRPSLILLDAVKARWTFPELKKKVLEMYREWEPDTCIVEKKAAGEPLIQELRAMGVPVQEFTPSRGGGDKVARLNAIADMFATGVVWAPERRWAKDVIEEVASFPNGEHDDYVDTVTQALMRYRKGGFISLESDQKDEPRMFRRRTGGYY